MRVPVAIVAVALNLSVTAASLTRQAPATGGAPAQPAGQAGTAASRPSPFVPPEPIDHDAHDGWTSIFDGRTLSGWDGNPDV